MVQRARRRAHRRAGRRLAADRRRRAPAGHRAHRLRQDPHRLPVGPRPAGPRRLAGGRHQRPLRLAPEGAQQRHPAQPPGAAGGAAAAVPGRRRALPPHSRPHPFRGHAPGGPAAHAAAAAGDPHHHPGVPQPAALLPGGARPAHQPAVRHPRRDPRRRRQQARRPPDHRRGPPRAAVGGVPADLPVGDGAAPRPGGGLRRRLPAPAGAGRRALRAASRGRPALLGVEALRRLRALPGGRRRRGRESGRLDLAGHGRGLRGDHRRQPLDSALRQRPPSVREDHPLPQRGPRAAPGLRPSRLPVARDPRGRGAPPEGGRAEGDRGHQLPGDGHRHRRPGRGRPRAVAAVGLLRRAARRPRRPPGRRGEQGHPLSHPRPRLPRGGGAGRPDRRPRHRGDRPRHRRPRRPRPGADLHGRHRELGPGRALRRGARQLPLPPPGPPPVRPRRRHARRPLRRQPRAATCGPG